MYGNLMMYFHPQDSLPMETLAHCPLCGEHLVPSATIDTRMIYLHDLAPGSEIVMCNGCGVVLQQRRLATMGWECYNEAFSSDGQAKWDHDTYRFEPELAALAQYCEDHAVVLDVGCNFGELTKLLCDKGYAAEGTDIRAAALHYGRRTYGLTLHEGFYNMQTAQAIGTRFDAIISVHAFEHFHDPLAGLQAMRYNLKGSGLVFLTVPDTEPLAPPTNRMPFDFFTSGHPFYYDRFTLEYLLKKAGFDVIAMNRNSDVVSERPVLRAIAKKRDVSDTDLTVPRPYYTTEDLIAFQTAFIRQREEAVLTNLALKNSTKVAVYGAWLYGLLTVKALDRKGHQVALVVDSDPDKWGHLLAGHVIRAPEEIKNNSSLGAVVITSIGGFEPIKHHIRRHLGLKSIPLLSIAGGIIRKKHAA